MENTKNIALRASPEDLGIIERGLIKQELLLGTSPEDLEHRFSLPPGSITDWIMETTAPTTPSVRRQLALLRLDRAAGILMEQAQGQDPDLARQAIIAYTQVQKREASLTGLDQPVKVDTDVRVQVAWLQPGRLAYRDGKELAEDIAHKATPQLPAPEDQ